MRKTLAVLSLTVLAVAACAGTANQAYDEAEYPSPSLDSKTAWPTSQQDSIDWFNADQDGRDTNVLIGNAAPRPQKKTKN